MAGFEASLAVNAAFQAFGVPATYTPEEGAPAVSVRVIRVSEGDVEASWESQKVRSRSDVFELRVSEVATAPERGAEIRIGDDLHRVKQKAEVKDADRLVWIVEAPRAGS